MTYYHINFKFREPYQVLVDEEIVLECIRTKFDLAAGLRRTLQGEVKPSTLTDLCDFCLAPER